MLAIYRHILAFAGAVVVALLLYGVESVRQVFAASGELPWLGGSVFVSVAWAGFLCLVVCAPVSAITVYVVERWWRMKRVLEPLALLVILALYAVPVTLLLSGGSVRFFGAVWLSLALPTLIYFVLLRAMGLREEV